jgi:hypothetical protein
MGKQDGSSVKMVGIPFGAEFFDDVLDTTEIPGPDGEPQTVQVEGIDVTSSAIRNLIAQVMKIKHPDVYADYRKMKYKGGPVPSLEVRRKAYAWLFTQFIEKTYNIPGM